MGKYRQFHRCKRGILLSAFLTESDLVRRLMHTTELQETNQQSYVCKTYAHHLNGRAYDVTQTRSCTLNHYHLSMMSSP